MYYKGIMKQTPERWNKREKQLSLELKCKDFKQAIALLVSIGDIAEGHNHHPDVAIKNYNLVFVAITTHDAGTLTDKDYRLAQSITDFLDDQGKSAKI